MATSSGSTAETSDASLACSDVATGKIAWREVAEWTETLAGRPQTVSTYRGSLLAVDGHYLCLGELGHLLWLDLTPKSYREIARSGFSGARNVGASRPQPRLAVCRAEHAGRAEAVGAETAVL